jgi:hypothetical protein
MEDLSPESLVLYNILKAETTEAFEERFMAHKEILASVRASIADTDHRIKSVHDSVDTLHTTVKEEIVGIKTALGSNIATVQGSLSAKISQLGISVDRAIRFVLTAEAGGVTGPQIWPSRDGVAGPSGHNGLPNCRGWHVFHTRLLRKEYENFSDLVDSTESCLPLIGV